MIIVRTPLRISLVGGGTDMPAFYQRSFGAVVSFGIDKYVYVTLSPKFDGKIRVSYSRTENVHHPMELKHDIIREALLSFNVNGIEVTTVADIPGTGTGLGSSSSLAVGLVNGLHRYCQGDWNPHPSNIAAYAYKIERELCNRTVGKQDHWAAAYGGVHYFQFEKDERVNAELLNFTENQILELENRFYLLWTGRARAAGDILKRQEVNLQSNRYHQALAMRDLAIQLRGELRARDFSNIGSYLHANWERKRQMAQGITSDWIDRKYQAAMEAGAEGGKLCGAGGGGFFLFFGKLGLAADLERATGLEYIPFKIDDEGSKVIYAS